MKTEDAILASTLAEIEIAASNLKTKIDSLKRLDNSAFNQLNEAVYESCDLNVGDALNVLSALTDALNQPN